MVRKEGPYPFILFHFTIAARAAPFLRDVFDANVVILVSSHLSGVHLSGSFFPAIYRVRVRVRVSRVSRVSRVGRVSRV